jgi:probable HAF family extracellular repeat protein
MERVYYHRMRLLFAILVSVAPGCADRPGPVAPITDSAAASAKQTGPLAVKQIIGLEPLIAGAPSSRAMDLNDLGHVVGVSADSAVRWNPDSSLFPEALPSPAGFVSATAHAINATGTIITGFGLTTSLDERALRWVRTNDTWVVQELGTLGGPESQAFDIADDGSIVGISDAPTLGQRGFLWQNGVMQNLSIIGMEDARAINNLGQIVGRATSGEALVWTPFEGSHLLGTPGSTASIALDINDQGEVVGFAESNANPNVAFFWTPKKGVVQLGSLGGHSLAAGINARGEIVGLSVNEFGAPHAVLWAKGKMLDLGVLPGHEESGAEAINNNGEVVGSSFAPAVTRRATLWRLK